MTALSQILMDKLMSDYGMKIQLQVIQLDFVLLNFLNYALMEAQIDSTAFSGKAKKLEKSDLFLNLLMNKEKRMFSTMRMLNTNMKELNKQLNLFYLLLRLKIIQTFI